uniref:protein-tyrosine-phosphatase n=1 Tax=Apophua simplicipes ichnovirus TaxID=1329648 RepID=S5DT42_9VIRU|nr:AsIV-cont00112-ORF1 [Apophua simplicipes ichnovirus]
MKNRYYHVSIWDFPKSNSSSNTATNLHYICANYANGMHEESKFIATAGKMFKTNNDFFDMVWQSNCGIVVVLTIFGKNEEDTSGLYWPTDVDDSWVTEEYTVSTKIVKKKDDFTKYFLELKNSKVPEELRNVSAYHYPNWPTDGVPEEDDGFKKMIAAVLLEMKLLQRFTSNRTGPIAVHGGSGIGRKGAFCMVNAYIQCWAQLNQ